jgi:hypothetical protein
MTPYIITSAVSAVAGAWLWHLISIKWIPAARAKAKADLDRLSAKL